MPRCSHCGDSIELVDLDIHKWSNRRGNGIYCHPPKKRDCGEAPDEWLMCRHTPDLSAVEHDLTAILTLHGQARRD